jgi:hypothetical protein
MLIQNRNASETNMGPEGKKLRNPDLNVQQAAVQQNSGAVLRGVQQAW